MISTLTETAEIVGLLVLVVGQAFWIAGALADVGRRLGDVDARLERIERLLAGSPDFHWPNGNGNPVQEDERV